MSNFRKKFLTQLGITFIIILFFAGLIAYVFIDLQAVGKSIEAQNKIIMERNRDINSFTVLRNDAERAQIIINKLQNALPSKESLFFFSEEMNQLARSHNLTTSFSFGEESASEAVGNLYQAQFNMSVSGEGASILMFIKDIENSHYFTTINSFDFFSQGINTTFYQATLSGTIFFRNNN